MKVHEVISEGTAKDLWDASKLGVSKLAARLGRGPAIEALAQKWAEELVQHGKRMTPAEYIVDARWSKDKAVIKAAEQQSIKLAREMESKADMAIIKGAAMRGAGKLADWSKNLAYLSIPATPLYQYNTNMNKYQQALDQGKITQEQFNQIRNQEASVMVATLSASMSLVGGAAGVLKFLSLFLPFKSLVNGLTPAAAAWLAYKFNTKEWHDGMAWLVSDAVFDMGNVVGGVATGWIDKFKQVIGMANAESSKPKQPVAPAAPATPQQPVSTNTSSGYTTTYDPNNGRMNIDSKY